MVPCLHGYTDGPELFVFNTLLPQDHPRNMRRFRIPPKYRERNFHVNLDYYRSLGTVNREGPLITDPTQAILIMSLSPTPTEPHVYLVLRKQALIEHACSMHADVQIPWDEWGRGAVAMETPPGRICLTIIHGARLLVMHSTHFDPSKHRTINVFDFSRRGSAALPLSDGDGGGTKRRAVFGDERSCEFFEGDGIGSSDRKLGDSMMSYIVSLLYYLGVEGSTN